MKNLLLLAPAALLGLTSCQQQPATKTAVAAPVPIAAATVAQAAPAAKPVEAPKPQLTLEMRAFLKANDLSPLWRTVIEDENPVQNGFFGKDNYRIEFVFTSVKRDESNPALFHVEGKNRFKKIITPFSGTIYLTQLLDQQPEDEASGLSTVLNSYVVLGDFAFIEQAAAAAGRFRGTVMLDLHIDDNGLPQREYSLGGKHGALGAGYIFKGEWVSASTKKTKSVVFADDFLRVGDTVLEDFSIGERGEGVNPKYAKLGWDTYWENEEWWAEPGTVTAQAAATDSL
ncbi:hypothetical protein [Hymenobacter weizhouensis]|uniref:hypothetical protein n=1 Tax=Hymenobacter sp. YIM 151500-1 TaxID=2987689 RepID=UPI00222786F1|nr:hypothetical protein [Hymenobacter sp. YIM 151500-1]UYZ63828.1 hypothetical protein OIS53_03055 [Hymenobacter sp. YIM 151500-1]